MIAREVAWRVFAGEYNASTLEYSDDGDMVPSYVITPLGAKINRLFVVGVLTDVENVGSDIEPLWRARVSDPTGVFYISSGQYQPEASHIISELSPPTFVAIIGKSRTYSPDEGSVYVSIRPEIVKKVNSELRDYWVLETVKSTKMRIEAMNEALRMEVPTVDELSALGFPRNLCEGVIKALDGYRDINLERYNEMIADALRYLLPEYEGAKTTEEKDEALILGLIEELDTNGKGASYDEVLSKAEGLSKDEVEETISFLMDKGLIYEPMLGYLKKI